MIRSTHFFFGILTATLLAGCAGGDGGTTVKATVVSSKVKLDDTDSVSVGFIPEGPGEQATAGGTITEQPLTASRAGDSTGVLPGKYKLVVNITPYVGMAPPARIQQMEEFCRLFNAENSKLSYEVTSDPEQSITVDLDANTVVKN